MILGAIADDFTGASDLANTLAKGGHADLPLRRHPGRRRRRRGGGRRRRAQVAHHRRPPRRSPSRCAALDWLSAQGCRQIIFKYCSTFDSTDAGNIGPVAEALADALGEAAVVVCPAFPGAGRTVYQGHLFVGDRLLSESGMERHPLTPMRDPDIRRVLARQSHGPVGHVAAAGRRRRRRGDRRGAGRRGGGRAAG